MLLLGSRFTCVANHSAAEFCAPKGLASKLSLLYLVRRKPLCSLHISFGLNTWSTSASVFGHRNLETHRSTGHSKADCLLQNCLFFVRLGKKKGSLA